MGKFFKRIKQLRLDNSLTQLDVAKELGVSTKTVSKWENGFYEPSFAMLEKIADFYQTTPNFLLGHESAKHKKTHFNENENKLLVLFNTLNEAEQGRAIGYLEALSDASKSKKKKSKFFPFE